MKNLKPDFYIVLMLTLFSCEPERMDSGPHSVKEPHTIRKTISDDEIRKKGLTPLLTINSPMQKPEAKTSISGADSRSQNNWIKITQQDLQFMKNNGNSFDNFETLRLKFFDLYFTPIRQAQYGYVFPGFNAIYLNSPGLVYLNQGGTDNSSLVGQKSVEVRNNINRLNITYNDAGSGSINELERHYSDWVLQPQFTPVSYPNYESAPKEMGGFNIEGWRKETTSTLGWHVTAGLSLTVGGKVGFLGISESHFNITASLEAGANGSKTETIATNFMLPTVWVPHNHMVTYFVRKRTAPIEVEYQVLSEFRGDVIVDYIGRGSGFEVSRKEISVPAKDIFHEYHKSPQPLKVHVSYPVEQYLVDYIIRPIY